MSSDRPTREDIEVLGWNFLEHPGGEESRAILAQLSHIAILLWDIRELLKTDADVKPIFIIGDPDGNRERQ